MSATRLLVTCLLGVANLTRIELPGLAAAVRGNFTLGWYDFSTGQRGTVETVSGEIPLNAEWLTVSKSGTSLVVVVRYNLSSIARDCRLLACGVPPPWISEGGGDEVAGGVEGGVPGYELPPPPAPVAGVPELRVGAPEGVSTPSGVLYYSALVALYVLLSRYMGWDAALIVVGVVVYTLGVAGGSTAGVTGGVLLFIGGVVLRAWRRGRF